MFKSSSTYFSIGFKILNSSSAQALFLRLLLESRFFSKQVCTEFRCPRLQLKNKCSDVNLERQSIYLREYFFYSLATCINIG